MLGTLVAALVAVQETTTTTRVPRIVGDPLPSWVTVAAGLAVLAAILVAGVLVNRRSRSS